MLRAVIAVLVRVAHAGGSNSMTGGYFFFFSFWGSNERAFRHARMPTKKTLRFHFPLQCMAFLALLRFD
jgi:hypothetical protein